MSDNNQAQVVTVSLAESILKEVGEKGLAMGELRARIIAKAGDSEENQDSVNWIFRSMLSDGKMVFAEDARLILPAYRDLAQIP